MLLALVWGVPALLRYHALPSIERAAKRGLQSGLEHSLDEVQHQVTTQLAAIEREQQTVLDAYEALWSSDGPENVDDELPERLRRMLLNSESSKGVLASTQS